MHMRTLALMAAATIGIPAAILAMVRVGMRTPTPQPDNSGEGGNEQGGQQ